MADAYSSESDVLPMKRLVARALAFEMTLALAGALLRVLQVIDLDPRGHVDRVRPRQRLVGGEAQHLVCGEVEGEVETRQEIIVGAAGLHQRVVGIGGHEIVALAFSDPSQVALPGVHVADSEIAPVRQPLATGEIGLQVQRGVLLGYVELARLLGVVAIDIFQPLLELRVVDVVHRK